MIGTLLVAAWAASAATNPFAHEAAPLPADPPAAYHAAHPPASAPADRVDGEVRRIDKAQGKVTLKHGEIRKLEMPSMTMVFRVQDPGLLDRLKPGDKVRFDVERIDGQFVVTTIEPAE